MAQNPKSIKPIATRVKKAVRHVLPGIIDVASPRKVFLFGSASQDRSGMESDLDFLVIVEEGRHVATLTDKLNMGIRNRTMPCDFIVATPSMLRKHTNDRNSIYHQALVFGRELYAAE